VLTCRHSVTKIMTSLTDQWRTERKRYH